MNLIMLLILLGALGVLVTPFAIGRLIVSRRQHSLAGILADLAEGRRGNIGTGSFLPVLPRVPIAAIAAEPHDMADCFEHRMNKTLQGCTDAISAALARFAEQGKAHYGEGYRQPMRVPGRTFETWMTRETALLRLRAGVYEPANAYRPGVTETGQLDMTQLFSLLAQEDALAAVAG